MSVCETPSPTVRPTIAPTVTPAPTLEGCSLYVVGPKGASQANVVDYGNSLPKYELSFRMELASDGRMSAVVTADNRETLELLKRDASALQKALEEGGLDLDSGNLAFNLRGEDGQTADGGDGSVGTPELEEELAEQTVDVQPELILNPEDVVLGEGRVDVKA